MERLEKLGWLGRELANRICPLIYVERSNSRDYQGQLEENFRRFSMPAQSTLVVPEQRNSKQSN